MKRFFNRFNGILLGGLLGGVLLVGLGSGIAFAEYVGFEYVAPSEGQESRATDEYSYTMDEGERVVAGAWGIEVDESIPEGTLLLRTEYDSSSISVEYDSDTLRLRSGSHYGSGNGYGSSLAAECSGDWCRVTELRTYPVYYADTFDLFLQHKAEVLEGLKEGKLITFEDDRYFRTTAVVNPADKDCVFISYGDMTEAYEAETGEEWPLG